MEIKQDSWHHKFYELGHGGNPPFRTNLCSYFWRTILGLCMVTICLGTALLFLIIIGVVFTEATAGAFTVLGGIAAIVGLFHLRNLILKREPGLLRLYLRAKKEKVCPLVEIV